MGKLLLSLFLSAFFALTLSANCGMNEKHKAGCEVKHCPMKMEKSKCDMPNCTNESCNYKMKKTSSKMSNCKNENCKMKMKKHSSNMENSNHHKMMKNHSMKKDAKKCGCGMTVESCKKMMVSCKFRDQREAKEVQSK